MVIDVFRMCNYIGRHYIFPPLINVNVTYIRLISSISLSCSSPVIITVSLIVYCISSVVYEILLNNPRIELSQFLLITTYNTSSLLIILYNGKKKLWGHVRNIHILLTSWQ